MVLSFAHPDDESFSAGITVAKYAANGWKIHLICVTDGQAGRSGRYENAEGDALGTIRKRETEDAARVLGISSVSFLSYKDGKLKDLPIGELEDVIYKKLIELSPHIVITFDTSGISNHPDHIRTCFSTTYAFQRYARDLEDTRNIVDASGKIVHKRHFVSTHMYALRQKSFTDRVTDDNEPKLYYVCMPQSIAGYFKKLKAIPAESYGKPWKGTPDARITTVIDGTRYASIKMKALKQHISQTEDSERFMGREQNPMKTKEFFILRMQGTSEIFMGKNDRVSDRL